MSVSIEIIREDGSFVPLVEIERLVIIRALETTSNMSKVAQILGIGRSTLYRKIKELGLESSATVRCTQRKRTIKREQPHFNRAEQAEISAREKEQIRQALQTTTNVPRLCAMLSMNEQALRRKIRKFGFCLTKAREAILLRQEEEVARHEAAGTLLIAA
jgi:transcriptional regulator with PAS, ATPase and Fis domain